MNMIYQIKKLNFKKKLLIKDINNKLIWLNLNILIIHNLLLVLFKMVMNIIYMVINHFNTYSHQNINNIL